MSTGAPFVLGGAQTDFARNATREGLGLTDLLREAALGALASAEIDATDVGVAHVGNFAAEIYSGQGHLGGLLVDAVPELDGIGISRHEAACASGSMAVLAATADLAAGRADVALVVGVELMRANGSFEAQSALGAAGRAHDEIVGLDFPWPALFSEVADEYDRRYGLDDVHLGALARTAFANGRRNPLAQTRTWAIADDAFGPDDELNPVVAGRLRRHDCSQVTDGAVAVVLATPEFAARWAAARGHDLDGRARIDGWGHRTSRMTMADKLVASRDREVVFPHVRDAVADAFGRAGVDSVDQIDALETHDCFTISEYAAIDHIGLTAPGESWKAIEEGRHELDGDLPINPSGGLIAAGHPVGATGVRMLWDAARQVTGTAGDTQVDDARRVATLNIGGSLTTVASFVVANGHAAR
ncbi:MAG TPA: acetyl-CoA acetyltransferase [Acidimicrobiales bacterium]|nr:acetyl-CoA acetyltransferase [Acidimicrobiales bacterium]